jgi:hypothetical protein
MEKILLSYNRAYLLKNDLNAFLIAELKNTIF